VGIKDASSAGPLAKAVATGPRQPLGPEALRLLTENRQVVQGLRQAVHANRCVWELKAVAPHEPIPSLFPYRTMANLLVLEGHEAARNGDARGAAERYLDAVRFGGDLREGPLISNLIGIAVAEIGLDALGRLTASEARPPLAQVRSEMTKLEGHLPTLVTALRQERLQLVEGLARVQDANEVFGVPPVLPLLVPYRLLFAQAAEAVDPRWRAIERASAIPDRAEAERIIAAAEPGPAWNPVFRLVSPEHAARTRVSVDLLAARFALVKAALALEEGVAKGGPYPKDAASLSLAKDPLSPSRPLRYERSADGRGYKLWSVGINEQDDGGASAQNRDLVLERQAPR
jgi:hypothetical protein